MYKSDRLSWIGTVVVVDPEKQKLSADVCTGREIKCLIYFLFVAYS